MREVNNDNNNHTYNTSSLANRSTTSLMREVGPSSCARSTSIAISLGQCPKNHVYDADEDACVSVYSHKFANKALSYALFKANQK